MICTQCGFERYELKKCPECNRRYQSKWYQANRDKHIERVQVREDKIYGKVYDYLMQHPCVDCRTIDPVVMHFDHRDTATKEDTVASMIARGLAWKRIKAEIDKCDVRCANCHMRRTAMQFGWRKSLMGEGR